MHLFISLLLVSVSLLAQQPADRSAVPAPAPKNLKLLAANSDIRFIMRNFADALGVKCTYCHVEGDFAADTNPKKEMARKMIAMVRLIDTSFPSSAGAFPDRASFPGSSRRPCLQEYGSRSWNCGRAPRSVP